MNPFNLTTFINSMANFISCNVDDGELGLLAAIFTQLGDTLATISVLRGLCDNSDNDSHKY